MKISIHVGHIVLVTLSPTSWQSVLKPLTEKPPSFPPQHRLSLLSTDLRWNVSSGHLPPPDPPQTDYTCLMF